MNKSKVNTLMVSTSMSVLIALLPLATASAQDEKKGFQLDEIMVTSTLRTKSVQDVPVTVSVLGEAQIAKADIHDAASIALNTPGLAYGEFSPGQAIFSMRGVGSADDGAGLDSSVALFLDGVYVGRGAGINFDMFDLERIEILKGPQGALFGRNTIGGAISVISKKPSDELIVKASGTYGNEGILRLQGMVSGPVSDKVGAKLVVNHRSHDGFVRNTLLNKDLNDEDTTSVRGQVSLDMDGSEWLLSGDYMEDHRDEAGRFPYVNGNFDYVGTSVALGAGVGQTSASPTEGFSDRKAGGASLQGDIEFNSGKLTTITGYRSVKTDWEMPSVGAPLGGGYNLDAGVYGADVIDGINEDVKTFSEELRWTSNLDGNINFIGGLFFFSEDTDRTEEFRIDRNTVATGQVIVGSEYTRTQNKTTSLAGYGQAQYQMSADWVLSVGGRFSHDKRDYTATAVNCGLDEAVKAAAGFPNFEPCHGVGGSLRIIAEAFEVSAKKSWSNFSPMASLQYTVNDDLMVFGTVSTGYKSGGYAGSQGVKSVATDPVNPEKVINYEIGFKGDFLDNHMRLNATAFYMDYKDLQVVRFGPVPSSPFGTFITTNLGSAKIQGVELEMLWQITEQFMIGANYAYLDTVGKDLIINGIDASGKDLRQAPRNSFNLNADYTIPLANDKGSVNISAQFSHMDEQRMDYLSDVTIAEKQNLTDARIAWTSADENYEISIWGKNIANKNYVSHTYIIGPGTIGTWGAPRTYGVTLTATF